MLIGNYFKNVNFKHRNHSFSNLSFHSSECKKNSIFFAIKGNLFDGNKFIKHAVKKGAKTIVSNQKFEGVKKKVLYIRSKNVRKTLSIVSFKLQKSIPKNMIAVTGTNGKSSIANFYFQLLKFNKKKVGLLGTLGVQTNNRNINVSNTTLDPIKLNLNLNKFKRKKIDNVILEASSHGLKQNRLDGLNFNTAIFTNLSHDHLDYHKNFQDYLNSKLYLFKSLLKKGGNIICDNQIPQYKKIIKIAHKRKLKINTISNKVGDISVISHKYSKDLQIVNLVYKNIHYSFSTNLIGKIQIKNLLRSGNLSEIKDHWSNNFSLSIGII